MEPLSETKWDLIVAGTGLPQSLLALALSRSDKKLLHVDKHDYYGGAEAALSLQEAEEWVQHANGEGQSSFRTANIIKPDDDAEQVTSNQDGSKLGFSRSYSLALAPQLIYTRSTLLSTLVSSKTYRQLEFLAVGSWWIYEKPAEEQSEVSSALKKIPAGREDIFADSSIAIKSKRALIKFVRLVVDPDAQSNAVEEHGDMSFGDYLTAHYGIPTRLQASLNALALSPHSPSHTKTSFALPRISRHLSSFGVFGAGFNAVIPKWGGTAEVAQVACRASAVGGGVYMLGKGIQSLHGSNTGRIDVSVADEDALSTQTVVGRSSDLAPATRGDDDKAGFVNRSITIISSHLEKLFPPVNDGPNPACSVVVFPGVSSEAVPVYVMVHSSDTGECPKGQSVLYALSSSESEDASYALNRAVELTLKMGTDDSTPSVLWKMSYQQQSHEGAAQDTREHYPLGTIVLPESSTDLAFDDSIFKVVKDAWANITDDTEGFMQFEDREVGAYDDEDE